MPVDFGMCRLKIHIAGRALLRLLRVKAPLATTTAPLRNDAVHLFVCLFVCRRIAYIKMQSYQKLSNLAIVSIDDQ